MKTLIDYLTQTPMVRTLSKQEFKSFKELPKGFFLKLDKVIDFIP